MNQNARKKGLIGSRSNLVQALEKENW